jgi:DNA-binding response OmpR family regulator
MNFPFKVLVIEDDMSMQHILNQCLKKYSLTILNNGMDALAFLQEGNLPDIIISDLNTPEVNGLQLIEQVKSSGFFSAIPIMILSGEDSTDTKITCLEAGADDYLIKPFNPRELEARLKNILRRIGKSVII